MYLLVVKRYKYVLLRVLLKGQAPVIIILLQQLVPGA